MSCEACDCEYVLSDFLKSVDSELVRWYDFHIGASWNKKTDKEKLIWRKAFEIASEIMKSERLDNYGK